MSQRIASSLAHLQEWFAALTEELSSARKILRATSIIGVASGINLIFQVLRVKVLALLLGPTGMGLFGMYQSILATASSLAAMGTNVSAIRQIAEARANDEQRRLGEITYVLRVLTIGLGAIGAAIVFMLRASIAHWTFGSTANAEAIGWLSIGVFVTVASQSLSALLQGYRRIGDQARLQVWSGALSTVLAIGAIALLGMDGVVVFVVAMPFVAVMLAWTFARSIGLTVSRLQLRSFALEARSMIEMGLAVMTAGALQGWALLAVRSHITQEFGLDTTGLFQSAWVLSFIYLNFVLDAMGKDYYPHLTEHVDDKPKAVGLICDQIDIAMILVGPLIIAMIAFAPVIVDILYSHSFRDAVPLVQWMGLGNFLKIMCWPIGFVILAQGRSTLFLGLELTWIAMLLGIALALEKPLGLSGFGVAFTIAYALNFVALYLIGRSTVGFQFSRSNFRMFAGYTVLVIATFLAARYSLKAGYTFGAVSFIVASSISYGKLKNILNRDPIALAIEKISRKSK